MAVLPVYGFAWGVGEAHLLAHRLGQHRGVVLLADDVAPKPVLLKQRRGQVIIAEPATALPSHRPGDASRILAIDYFLQPRNDVSVAVLAEFDHDPAAAHLVGYRTGDARTGKRIEDEVARVR